MCGFKIIIAALQKLNATTPAGIEHTRQHETLLLLLKFARKELGARGPRSGEGSGAVGEAAQLEEVRASCASALGRVYIAC